MSELTTPSEIQGETSATVDEVPTIQPAAPSPIIVAVDDGFAATKLAMSGKTLTIPTAIASGVRLRGSLDGRLDDSIAAFRVQGEHGPLDYSIGEGLEAAELDGRSYHGSPANVAMVHAALHKAGLAGRKVNLVLGVPLRDFYRDGAKNEPLLAAKKKAMLAKVERHRAPEGKAMVEIASVQVLPQAIAAVGSLLFDDQGKARGAVGTVAVVDVGGETTDLAVVLDGRQVDHSRSTSEHGVGVLAAKRRLAARLRERFELDEALPWSKLDGAFRTKRVEIYGKVEDIATEVSESISQTEQDLIEFVRRKLGSGAHYSSVLFIGGGASLFGRLSTLYPRNGRVVPNGDLANAKGMLSMALSRQSSKRA